MENARWRRSWGELCVVMVTPSVFGVVFLVLRSQMEVQRRENEVNTIQEKRKQREIGRRATSINVEIVKSRPYVIGTYI